MHFRDIVERDGRTISFEFFPPRTEGGWEMLFGALKDLEPLAPSFVSVTYGAGGSTRDRTHQLVERLRRETSLDAIPHLTCVGHSSAEIEAILERYAAAGVSNILALRGDFPPGMTPSGREADAFRHAIGLVEFIRGFVDRHRGAHPDPRGFGIGVAGFPEGHPETPNQLRQMDHLKAKVDAGADWVCTQLFFDNAMFYDWRDRCRLAGIALPLLAGVMPVTSIAGLHRMAELAGGTRVPATLLRAIGRCGDDPDAVARVGIHWATEQCRDLLDNGVEGIHFYTLNRSDATMGIYRALGARSSAALRT
ncbi:MAG TPA: methylenetetrahydrofolate reductase [NAD(P)H] [Phycisphaerales bacterium]|nr:methylenetetrahydrofolate reductase [NAD(P)H] [Phycisphaerales bacterium]HMP37526.1 methylenetetrahydrofolate reductase [NAD(P)H] [Phycisphaerales bacterium]